MLPLVVQAFAHRARELRERPGPDADFRIRGDVGRMQRAEVGVERQTTGIRGAARFGVATCAVGRGGEITTALDGALIGLHGLQRTEREEQKRDATGRLTTDASLQTSLAGVFAAGAVRAGCGGNLIDAQKDGEAAGAAVAKLLGK